MPPPQPWGSVARRSMRGLRNPRPGNSRFADSHSRSITCRVAGGAKGEFRFPKAKSAGCKKQCRFDRPRFCQGRRHFARHTFQAFRFPWDCLRIESPGTDGEESGDIAENANVAFSNAVFNRSNRGSILLVSKSSRAEKGKKVRGRAHRRKSRNSYEFLGDSIAREVRSGFYRLRVPNDLPSTWRV